MAAGRREGLIVLRFRTAGASSCGLVRTHNEDAGFVGPYLLLVADGVAGGAAGEVAAASTAYVVTAASTMSEVDNSVELLSSAVTMAHEHLVRGCADDPSRAGMSTTLTAVLSDGRRVGLAHVGDSRAYRWRRGSLTRLTTDHTLVQSLLDEGQLTAEQAASYPYRSVIMRSLNPDSVAEVDLSWVEVEPGDRLLVCSDGLSDLVAEDQIAASMAEGTQLGGSLSARDGDRRDLDEAVDQLITAALAAGGRDNVTCVLGEVVDGPPVRPFGRALGAFSPPNLIDGTVIKMMQSHGHRRVRLDSTG